MPELYGGFKWSAGFPPIVAQICNRLYRRLPSTRSRSDLTSILVPADRNSILAKRRLFRYSGDMALTRHCWKCGTEYTLPGGPGRSEACHHCGSDLKVCLNCVSYDLRAAYQCRDRRADPVLDKATGNFCEYFDFIRRVFAPANQPNAREQAARDNLKKLFGD